MYSTSSCEWSSIQHHLVSGLLERGGSEQHKGPQSLFVERLLEGGGVRTTHGAAVFVCRNKKKQRKGIAERLFQGGCFLCLLFWGTPKDMDLRNAYMYSLPRHLTV